MKGNSSRKQSMHPFVKKLLIPFFIVYMCSFCLLVKRLSDVSNVEISHSSKHIKTFQSVKLQEKEEIRSKEKESPKEEEEEEEEEETIQKLKEYPLLTSYTEVVDQSEWEMKPLPIRKNAKASKLAKVTYPKLNSCKKLQSQWPVDEFPSSDPFLPWIHDVFPSPDGKKLNFIAQNLRRCHVGDNFEELKMHLQPQLSLFQHIPVKRISSNPTRYRLSSHADADPDADETRFICRFKPSNIETLAKHQFNYDYFTFRRRRVHSARRMFNINGQDHKNNWNSQLLFYCPIPQQLQQLVKDGNTVINDYATLFVDLIPIRTPPRYGVVAEFLPPKYEIVNPDGIYLNATEMFGNNHILPLIEDSGRWENIPICKPSLQTYTEESEEKKLSSSDEAAAASHTNKPANHTLVACTWTAKSYNTRKNMNIPDGDRRLYEWITHNLMIGFDHIYIYDNTGAFNQNESLESVTSQFPSDKVTRIDWPAKICNNNPENINDRGERSSQYAADASCLYRFGPHTKWMSSIDVDEYLVPMGKHNDLKSLMNKIEREEDDTTKVLCFQSFRSRPILDRLDQPKYEHCFRNDKCFNPTIRQNSSYLHTFNCENEKPSHSKLIANPAEKEIYRADFTLLHYVHYSEVVTRKVWTKQDYKKAGIPWNDFFWGAEKKRRFADGLTEGTMIHTKTVPFQHSREVQAYFGFPWPNNTESNVTTKNSKGYNYNCFINEVVDAIWAPKLHQKLKEQAEKK